MLASLWSVNDESTALLMRSFYSHWLDDPDHPSKAESLRRAQADVRKTPGFEHPIYWAGCYVQPDDETMLAVVLGGGGAELRERKAL